MSGNHSTWAKYYDEVNRECFGIYYDQLTELTLSTINNIGDNLSIVDFGAGTGRLSIPLSRNHRVTAVEPSASMLQQLQLKDTPKKVTRVHAAMHEYQGNADNDLALAVFTVISYILTEEQLVASFKNVAQSLKSDGQLLLDVPKIVLFRDNFCETNTLRRDIKFKELGDRLFEYSENTKIRDCNYTDTFKLRYWSTSELQSALQLAGIVIEKDLSSNFPMAGAYYWLCRKT